jgi:hypothetical protein
MSNWFEMMEEVAGEEPAMMLRASTFCFCGHWLEAAFECADCDIIEGDPSDEAGRPFDSNHPKRRAISMCERKLLIELERNGLSVLASTIRNFEIRKTTWKRMLA